MFSKSIILIYKKVNIRVNTWKTNIYKPVNIYKIKKNIVLNKNMVLIYRIVNIKFDIWKSWYI